MFGLFVVDSPELRGLSAPARSQVLAAVSTARGAGGAYVAATAAFNASGFHGTILATNDAVSAVDCSDNRVHASSSHNGTRGVPSPPKSNSLGDGGSLRSG